MFNLHGKYYRASRNKTKLEMADDSRAERILSDLCGVLRREKNISEFGFVYCPEPLYNKSPIISIDGNLGIETWSIKPLYFHAYSQLFHHRHRPHDLKRVSDCSMAVLLLNPECLSAWNLRKQLILNKYLKSEDELNLARLILSKHPKSPETFSQRRWLLQQLCPVIRRRKDTISQSESKDDNPTAMDPNAARRLQEQLEENAARQPPVEDETLMRLVRAEMDVCALAAGRYPSNYNAWSHRIWVVEHLAGSPPQFVRSELAATKPWVSAHISDHSGFHYRQFLLGALTGLPQPTRPPSPGSGVGSRVGSRVGSDAGWPGGLVLEELQLILELVTSYPGHEAVWYHRRFVIYLWKTLLCNGISTELDQVSHNARALSGIEPSDMREPSPNRPSIKDCPIADQLHGKRPSENQPIGSHAPGQEPIENGQSEASAPTRGEDSQTGTVEDGLKRGIMFSPMPLASNCSHDASLLHLPGKHISDQLPLQQTSFQDMTTSQVPQSKPVVTVSATANPSAPSEVHWLVQHEKRFVDIVVDGTIPAEKAAQKRCAENYCRWLESLHIQ
ncbi:protein prenyltransferase alpha subunit repeat-containing protein 1-like [Patiria miniata]|uniref:Protein prenyltransferase alpha subunit repeat-containing protein 1 n=1 Tax=Patiria miniata TaxID=46514 RepID=A0A914BRJ2_PATMI|nr:protein prenyltransferase alpha subunit repeat-containing protein 1-like [Patiria miniata]